MLKNRSIIIAILSCFCLVLAAACGGKAATTFSSATPSPTPLTATQILSGSSQKMEAVTSFHFSLEHSGGGTPIAMGIEMIKAVGDLVKPDKLKTVINGTAAGSIALQVQVITIGSSTYMTNPLNGKWELLPNEFQVLSVFDPSKGIAAIMKGMKNAERLSDESLQGTACYHLSGDIDSGDLSSITGGSMTGVTVKAEAWIAQNDLLPRQFKLAGKITETEKEGIIRTLIFSNYNQDIKIESPI